MPKLNFLSNKQGYKKRKMKDILGFSQLSLIHLPCISLNFVTVVFDCDWKNLSLIILYSFSNIATL